MVVIKEGCLFSANRSRIIFCCFISAGFGYGLDKSDVFLIVQDVYTYPICAKHIIYHRVFLLGSSSFDNCIWGAVIVWRMDM